MKRTKRITADNYALARELAKWKNEVLQKWSDIEVLEVKYPDSSIRPLNLGEHFAARISLRLNGLDAKYIGVEVVTGEKEDEQIEEITKVFPMELEKVVEDVVVYNCDVKIPKSGVTNFAFRVFPMHPELPHRQDFPLVKWI